MAIPQETIIKIYHDLLALEVEFPNASGCYHLETDPPHVLFNLNCPAELEDRVRNILSKYTGDYEGRSSQH